MYVNCKISVLKLILFTLSTLLITVSDQVSGLLKNQINAQWKVLICLSYENLLFLVSVGKKETTSYNCNGTNTYHYTKTTGRLLVLY